MSREVDRPLVVIGGYGFPEPSTYNSTTATFVDSARNAQGVVIGAVVRENVAKVEMTWRFLYPEQWARMTACFDSTRGGSFYNDVTFYNQDTNDWETRKMYVSDRTAEMFMREDNASGRVKGFLNPRIALVEV